MEQYGLRVLPEPGQALSLSTYIVAASALPMKKTQTSTSSEPATTVVGANPSQNFRFLIASRDISKYHFPLARKEATSKANSPTRATRRIICVLAQCIWRKI